MKGRQWVSNIIRNMSAGMNRFPESIILDVLMVISLITAIEIDSNNELWRNITLTLIVGVIVATSLRLLIERQVLKVTSIWVLRVVIVIGLIGLYFYLPEKMTQQSVTFYVHIVLSNILVFIMIPYYFHKPHFGFYSLRVALKFLTTIFYALVLFAGVSGLVFALESLFYLDFTETIYLDVLIVSMGLFGVVYFLSTIEKYDEEHGIWSYPKAIKLLITMILIPLSIAYTLIMYAYFVQILITMTWPKGVVGQLVIWYGVLAFVTYFLLDHLELKKRWQQVWLKIFPFLFIIPLGMMGLAVGLRIHQYGLTILRYMVILIGIWFVIALLITILPVKAKRMSYVLCLTFILALTSIGPLSGVNMSFYTQRFILEQVLRENDMLVDGVLVARGDLSEEDKSTITGAVKYIQGLDMIDRLDYIPDDYELYGNDRDLFGFDFVTIPLGRRYFSYRLAENAAVYVEGYVIPFEIYRQETYILGEAVFSWEGREIVDEVTGEVYNLDSMADALSTYNIQEESMPLEAMTYIIKTDYGTLTLVFQYVDFEYDGEYELASGQGLMIYEKDQ